MAWWRRRHADQRSDPRETDDATGDLKAGVLSAEAEPSVTAIEHRGIEHVPQDSRWGSEASLFWMWVGHEMNSRHRNDVHHLMVAIVNCGRRTAPGVLNVGIFTP